MPYRALGALFSQVPLSRRNRLLAKQRHEAKDRAVALVVSAAHSVSDEISDPVEFGGDALPASPRGLDRRIGGGIMSEAKHGNEGHVIMREPRFAINLRSGLAKFRYVPFNAAKSSAGLSPT